MRILLSENPFEDAWAKIYYTDGPTRYYTEPEGETVHVEYDFYNIEHAVDSLLTCSLLVRGIFLPEHYDKRLNQRFFNVEMVLDGCMYARSNNITFLAEPGDIVLMLPHENHEFRPAGVPLKKIGIMLEGRALDMLLQSAGILQSQVFTPTDTTLFYSALKELRRLMALPERKEEVQSRISAAAFRLIVSVSDMRPQGSAQSYFNEIRTFIEKNLSNGDLLQNTLRHFNLSAFQLCRLFKNESNTTPGKYIMTRRMVLAAEYLLRENFAVKEVAMRVGYENPLNFSTAFRRYYNSSPKDFRTKGTLRKFPPQIPDV